MSPIEDFELKLMELEELLRPIADRPVDISKPGWIVRIRRSAHPLDEAGIRSEAGTLLENLIAFYQTCEEVDRQAIRRLFVVYRAFAWAAGFSFGATRAANLRRHLLLFSIKDQGLDSRDELVHLQELCRESKKAGVTMAPILREIAELSSDVDKYGMGSTRKMLLRAAEQESGSQA